MRPNRRSEIKKKVLDAYAATLNISSAARAAQVTRRTIYNWVTPNPKNKAYDPDFAEAIADIDESFLDICEGKLRDRIAKDEWVPLKYYLENRAPHRWRDGSGALPVELTGGSILNVRLTKVIDGTDAGGS